MKAKTLIVLGVIVVLTMMVVPALARSPLASMPASAAAVSLPETASLAQPQKSAVASGSAQPRDPNGIAQLAAASGGALQISVNRATGLVSFVAVSPAAPDSLSKLLAPAKSQQAQADAFWAEYGGLFGIEDPDQQLEYVGSRTDYVGATRLEYRQVHEGVPVFAGILFVHFNDRNQLTAVNGVSVPDITVTSTPRLTTDQAGQIAVNAVGLTGVEAVKTTLYIYRTGLAQGVKGLSYLAYEVEATNGVNVRDFVIVDALSGKIIDRWSAIENTLIREVYSGTFALPARIWKEGDAIPYTGVFSNDINNLIYAGAEVYNLFSSGFGRDSYDAAGAIMRTVNNDPGIQCPNANWNGITTNYCNDVTGDDTVAHEWGHAYTEYTHNLIYAWQPGALNESYSDIWGEVVDLLNGRGKDAPGGLRTDGACSIFSSFPVTFTVSAPPALAGGYPVQGASTPEVTTAITNIIVVADDGVGVAGPGPDGAVATLADACTPLVNAAQVNGKFVLINRGTCTFVQKINNAIAAGAAGIIVANHGTGGDALMSMSAPPTSTTPAVFVGYSTGAKLHTAITQTITSTIRPDTGALPPDNSYRWLSGEDDPAFGGAIRDMWLPGCYRDPNKVIDTNYQCSADDGGGVHTNSGVPNHAFALLVDGGAYNGYTITAIGLTKASHLYWRAQDVYQTPTTDFADHADALTASCNDLVLAGTNLPALSTGISTTVGSGQVFTTTDCLQVTKAISATELRIDPTVQCGFTPLLDPATPALCAAGTGSAVAVFTDTFEVASGWTVTHTDVFSATNYEWVRRGSLPDGRVGQAFFGVDETGVGSCNEGIGDVSRVMYLTSPSITAPTSTTALRMAFDHWVATEQDFDGGNLWISVEGGNWQLVDPAAYTFNAYNATLDPSGTSPLAGQPAFSGSDGGQVTGSWGTSLVDLHSYIAPGESFQLRYAMGTDGCGGREGWYVDDVEAYYCSADLFPEINVPQVSVTSQQGFGTVMTKTLTINNTGSGNLIWEIIEASIPGLRSAVQSGLQRAADSNAFVPELLMQESKVSQPTRPTYGTAPAKPDATNVVQDGSFEAGSPNPFWSEFDQLYGTPLCDPGACGAGARTGVWYVWLGGGGSSAQSGYVSQPITITPGLAKLNFWLVIGAPGSGTGNFTVTLDSTVLFTANQTMTPTLGGSNYHRVSLDVSSFANGGQHVLKFSESDPAGPGGFNALVDDVSLDVVDCQPTDLPWLTVSPNSGTTGAYGSSAVDLVFNAVNRAGTYTGKLCITSNDPTVDVIEVPVMMKSLAVFLPIIRR
jgi:Zn-dependent metalloprotease